MRKAFFMAVAGCVWASGFLGASLCPAAEPTSRPATRPKLKFTISPATTHILGPVKADGTIDYVAAFEARLGKGVTPANNAAIPLLRALGPEFPRKEVRAGVLKRLGMAPLPAGGNYFVESSEWVYKRKRALTGPWSAEDLPQVAAWLTANTKPLAVAVAASQRPRYYLPVIDPRALMIGRAHPHLGTVRDLGRALVARAMLKLQRGQADGARADLLAVHRLARLMGQSQTLIGCMVAYTMDRVASAAETALAASGSLTAAQGRAHLADLRALSPLPSVRHAFNVAERWTALDCVMVYTRMADFALTDITEMPTEPGRGQGRQPDWD